MSEASDKHDEQCANLKKAAAICEHRGQSLVDSLIALQAKVDELKTSLVALAEADAKKLLELQATITEQQRRLEFFVEGTDGSTPAIVTICRLRNDAEELQATITDMSRSNALQATIDELEAQATITEQARDIVNLNAHIDKHCTIEDDQQATITKLTAALTKIRDHKSPHLGLRDNARRYIAEQALKQEDET